MGLPFSMGMTKLYYRSGVIKTEFIGSAGSLSSPDRPCKDSAQRSFSLKVHQPCSAV